METSQEQAQNQKDSQDAAPDPQRNRQEPASGGSFVVTRPLQDGAEGGLEDPVGAVQVPLVQRLLHLPHVVGKIFDPWILRQPVYRRHLQLPYELGLGLSESGSRRRRQDLEADTMGVCGAGWALLAVPLGLTALRAHVWLV